MDFFDDMDGDGIVNGYDPDMDGDGTMNELDYDMENDGVYEGNLSNFLFKKSIFTKLYFKTIFNFCAKIAKYSVRVEREVV